MAAKFTPKKNKVTGTKKKDKIVWQNKSAWKRNLTVDAGLKNDTIDFTKSSKTNTFIGGKGNDTIKTGKGTSTIVINKGDGNDTIYNNGKKTTIKFNKPNSKDKVTAWEKKGNDLIMTYTHVKAKKEKKAVTEKITLKNFYKNDGTIANTNLYLKNKYNKKTSTLVKDLKITSVKGVLRGTYKGETLNGTNGNDKIYGNGGNDIINGGAGDDVIYGVSGTNILNGGKGSDILYSGTGVDTFKFASGDGNDTIYDATSVDKIEFTGDVDSVNYSKENDDLIITRTTGTVTDKVTIANFLNAKDRIDIIKYNGSEKKISENFVVMIESAADNIVGTSYNDHIIVTKNSDATTPTTIIGGAGDDIMERGDNNTQVVTYKFDQDGEGNDTIIDNLSAESYVDFTNITAENVVAFNKSLYYEEKDNDLIIHYGDSGSITIKDYVNRLVSDKNNLLYSTYSTTPRTILNDLEDRGVEIIASSDDGETLNGSLLAECTMRGGAGDDVITSSTRNTTIIGGAGNDILKRKEGTSTPILYCFNIEGDGNDVIYDTLTNNTFDRELWFYGEGNTSFNENYLRDAIHYEMSGNDLVMTYGTKVNSSVTIKDFAHSFVGTAESKQWRLKLGGGHLALSVAQNTIYTNVTNKTTLNNLNWKYVLAGSADNTVTTKTDFSTTVYGGSGTNTINSYGNDSIVVDKEGNDTINLYGANTEKSVWVETGSKATINGVMDLIPSGLSSVPLTINFTDQDFTKNDVMLYHNYYTNELHFVTRNYGLDVALTGIYDGPFNEDNAEGSNYIYEEEGNNAFAKFNIIDKNGNLANIRELTNYYDMSKHSNEFCNEFEAIYFGQNGSLDWLIDSSDAEANDSYETYIPRTDAETYIPRTDAKIDIYDKGGNDELIFESPFVNANGNSTFFDVIITRNSDNSLASSSFGDDLYFSGDMSKLFDDNSSNDTYTCVHNYFDASSENQKGVGYIETIEDENSYTIDFDKLSALKGQIAGWIAGNTAYSSVSDVIANGSAKQKETLMAYFTEANPYVTA
ncbi:hypothetical protein IKP85_04025 [bacterium]|nr:hypothetical protein [bacterium]